MTAELEKTQIDEVSLAVAALQKQVALLEAKIARLEAAPVPAEKAAIAPAASPAPVAAAAIPVAAAPVKEEISEEIMLVLAAAVAAFLGERAHIRVARMVTSPTWAQVGRVSIQASHRLGVG